MKINDFAPRTGCLEAYLTGENLVGVEVGVDTGSHAESILTYCSIKKLWLVDPWENPFCEGYCAGRLTRWRNKVCFEKGKSREVVKIFDDSTLDFVYLDQEHDYITGREDLNLWWEKIKPGGIMAMRNYSSEGLKRAAYEFINNHPLIPYEIDSYTNEILIFK